MAITRTPMTDDDGSGTTGTVINAAWKTELYDQIDATPAGGGIWTDVPHSVIFFSASGTGAWSTPVAGLAAFRYLKLGKLVVVHVEIAQATVSGAPTALQMDFPIPAARPIGNPLTLSGFFLDNSVNVVGYIQAAEAAAGAIRLSMVRWDWAPWQNSAAATAIWGMVLIPIY
jgi:hypothetical protein